MLNTPSNRATVVATGVILLLSCGVLGGYFYLKHQSQAASGIDRLASPDPSIVARTEAKKEARVLELRTRFETWAKAHQDDIRAMMLARSDDLAALRKVSSALPNTPLEKRDGLDLKDFADAGNLSDPEVFNCQWAHIGVGAIAASPELEQGARKAERKIFFREEEAFKSARDFVVLWVSSSWSKKQYALWVSGKITCDDNLIPMANPQRVAIRNAYSFLPQVS